MADVKDKACPFRVHRVDVTPSLTGIKLFCSEEFAPCMGEGCAAYYRGACLRLMPPIMAYDPTKPETTKPITTTAEEHLYSGLITEE